MHSVSAFLLLALAIVLFIIAVGFMISYIKDRKRYKNAFKKRH
ncbi:TPA: small membrane protein [Klebsiella pneumoniae]|nr:small membrane protein [Klebsiella pneumoniae]